MNHTLFDFSSKVYGNLQTLARILQEKSQRLLCVNANKIFYSWIPRRAYMHSFLVLCTGHEQTLGNVSGISTARKSTTLACESHMNFVQVTVSQISSDSMSHTILRLNFRQEKLTKIQNFIRKIVI